MLFLLALLVGQGSASVASGAPAVMLSSMNTDSVCEQMKQIEGMDQSILGQYTATIKKVRLGRDELSPRAFVCIPMHVSVCTLYFSR